MGRAGAALRKESWGLATAAEKYLVTKVERTFQRIASLRTLLPGEVAGGGLEGVLGHLGDGLGGGGGGVLGGRGVRDGGGRHDAALVVHWWKEGRKE